MRSAGTSWAPRAELKQRGVLSSCRGCGACLGCYLRRPGRGALTKPPATRRKQPLSLCIRGVPQPADGSGPHCSSELTIEQPGIVLVHAPCLTRHHPTSHLTPQGDDRPGPSASSTTSASLDATAPSVSRLARPSPQTACARAARRSSLPRHGEPNARRCHGQVSPLASPSPHKDTHARDDDNSRGQIANDETQRSGTGFSKLGMLKVDWTFPERPH